MLNYFLIYCIAGAHFRSESFKYFTLLVGSWLPLRRPGTAIKSKSSEKGKKMFYRKSNRYCSVLHRLNRVDYVDSISANHKQKHFTR